MVHRLEKLIGGKPLILETGRMARQAHGAVLVRYGETTIFVAVVASKDPKPGVDFLPLFVDYRERAFAGGKIPGGFFKREGRPSEREILCARQIDRPIRPLFPKGYRHDVMVMVTVLSADQENQADVLGLIGASAALNISHLPVTDKVASVRVGYIDGQYVLNPTFSEMEKSTLDLVVAGTREDIVMVEGGAAELPSDIILGGLEFARRGIGEVIDLIEEITRLAGVEKSPFTPVELDPALKAKIRSRVESPLDDLLTIAEKQAREETYSRLVTDTIDQLAEEYPEMEKQISSVIGELEKEKMRAMVLETGRRVDGRGPKDIRTITCEIQVLPRVHGSSLFTRGQTQALVSATLGTSMDSQVIDSIEQAEYRKKFMLHYNFPSFSVGEVGIPRGPGRREIGHGALAERAIRPMIDYENFPYTVRLVSDIMESNGSSSMATVCGGSLALMDAGVPLKRPVAGIAMGLIYKDGKYAVLSDILGLEDHLGDMDFKIAGSREGLTAFQLDSKMGGIPFSVLGEAVNQAVEGYKSILDLMDSAIDKPREEISPYAPRIITIKIHPDKIREVIGPGGKMIRKITEESGAKIEIEDDGTVTIASADENACNLAIEKINEIAAEPEIGRIYNSQVKTVTSFGAFVEFMPGREGLVHVSELERGHVKDVEQVVKVGDRFKVKLIGIDKQNRVKLSRVAAMDEEGK